MAINGLKELFGEGLRAVYAANQRGAEAAEATIQAASNPELKQMLQSGTEMAKGQVKRLEQVFQAVGAQPSGRQNDMIDGIIAASRKIVDEPTDASVRDAGIIASGQIAFHYYIAAYGTLASYARTLDMNEAADLLHQTLEEFKQHDEDYSRLAKQIVNPRAS